MKKSVLAILSVCFIAVCFCATVSWCASSQAESATSSASDAVMTCAASGSNPYISSVFPGNALLQALLYNVYPAAQGYMMKFIGKFLAGGTGVYTWNAYTYVSQTKDFALYSINLVKTDTNYWLYTLTIGSTTCSGLLQKTYAY